MLQLHAATSDEADGDLESINKATPRLHVQRYVEELFGPELDAEIARLAIKAGVPHYNLTKAYVSRINSFQIHAEYVVLGATWDTQAKVWSIAIGRDLRKNVRQRSADIQRGHLR